MGFRMLEYLVVAARVHGRVPKQVLLYVGPQPLRMANHFKWDDGVARFTILDLREIDAEPLLASPEPSDNVVAILGRLGNSRAALRRILEKLAGLPREEAAFYGQALLVLAGLRGLAKVAEEETQQMLSIGELLAENEVLGPAYRRGLEEGREEGREKGERTLLRRLIEQRFGLLPSWAEQQFAARSREDMAKLADRLLQAATLDDLLG